MGKRIIIIDNDQSIQELLSQNLQSRGYEALKFDYAHLGLTDLELLHPDLVILDFNGRDGGQGWGFLQMLKMDDLTARIPVIIVSTAINFAAELSNYLSMRFIQVVNKPFASEAILLLVQTTLRSASQAGVIFSSDHPLPILVVDDTEDLRETLTTVLGLEGYSFVTANNGLEALNALSEADFCLILLDIEMPIMNGFDFLIAYDQQLRSHTPVFILSGAPDIQTRVLPAFVIEVLPKPFVIAALLATISIYAQPVG